MDVYVRSGKPRQQNIAKPRSSPERTSLSPVLCKDNLKHSIGAPLSAKEQLEDELRLFDLDSRYGPFVGIDRIARWQRAHRLGLEPPEHILQILTQIEVPVDKQREGGHLW
jgi:DNA polymerase delta, subunit 4